MGLRKAQDFGQKHLGSSQGIGLGLGGKALGPQMLLEDASNGFAPRWDGVGADLAPWLRMTSAAIGPHGWTSGAGVVLGSLVCTSGAVLGSLVCTSGADFRPMVLGRNYGVRLGP